MGRRWLLLLLLPALAPAQETIARYGQWTVSWRKTEVRIANGDAQLGHWFPYPFPEYGPPESIDHGVRFRGPFGTDKTPLTATLTCADGKLAARYETAGPAKYQVVFKLAGGSLGGTSGEVDGQPFTVPAEMTEGFRPKGKDWVLFADQDTRRLRVSYQAAGLVEMKDRRQGSQGDVELFATADSDGVVAFTVDFTRATLVDNNEAWEGQRYIKADDLHLPDLSLCRNLVQNPGFEGGLAHWGWGVTGISEPPTGQAGVDWGWSAEQDDGPHGRTAARYVSRQGYNPPMLCTLPIAVREGETYTVSFRARTDRPGAGFSFLIHTARWPVFPVSERYALTGDWQTYTATFQAPNPFLRLCFGDRWWDDEANDTIDGARILLDDVQLEAGSQATEFVQKPLLAWTSTGYRAQAIPVDRPARATVRLLNATATARTVQANVTVSDWRRRPLKQVEVQADLAPWETAERPVDLTDVDRPGLLRLIVDAKSGRDADTFYGRAVRYQPIAAATKVRYLYNRTPSPAEIPWLQSLGVWGSLTFKTPDDPELAKIYQDQDWFFISGTDRKGSPIKPKHEEMTPEKWTAYDQWLAQLIEPQTTVPFWKTLNEPNGGGGGIWTMDQWVRAVGLIRKHAKQANPNAVILTPDPTNASESGRRWIEQFLAAGGDKLVDAVAIHTYRHRPEEPDLDQDLQDLIALKAQYGLAATPIYLTEGEGYPIYAVPELGMGPTNGFWEWRLKLASYDVGRAELLAGAMMQRTLLAAFKNQSQVATYLTWRDDFNDDQPLASMGMVNALLNLIGQATFERDWDLGPNVKAYTFRRTDGRSVTALWTFALPIDRGVQSPMTATIPARDGWELRDAMDDAITPDTVNGRWRFPIDGHPTFVIGPAGAAVELAGVTVEG